MDLTTYAQSLILGIVEGLTEFLPISSTGHLIITGDLLGVTGEKAKTFEIVIQLGAILAVAWFYRARFVAVAYGLPNELSARRFVLNIAIAFLPAAIVGLLLHDFIKAYLFTPLVVAWALIIGGFAIIIIEKYAPTPRVASVDRMTWKHSLLVGCAQIVSLIPGVSRSGATIMGGLAFGMSRQTATEFSFFLAVPIMIAATFYDLLHSWQVLDITDIGIFATGFITAFLSALVAIRFLLHYVAHHDFSVFAWYRILIGSTLLAYYTFS